MSSLMRFQYVIGGELRFLSHLDLVRTFERALRRPIPAALTEGFHPKPKLSFACPLAVGITSQAEYGDVVLLMPHPQEFACRLNQVFPQGLRIAGGYHCREDPSADGSRTERNTALSW